jgi:hypothetical protein
MHQRIMPILFGGASASAAGPARRAVSRTFDPGEPDETAMY